MHVIRMFALILIGLATPMMALASPCLPGTQKACSLGGGQDANGMAAHICASVGNGWGPCQVVSCKTGYNLQGGACVANTACADPQHQHFDTTTRTCVWNQYSISAVKVTPNSAWGQVKCNGGPCDTTTKFTYGTQIQVAVTPSSTLYAAAKVDPGASLTIADTSLNVISVTMGCSDNYGLINGTCQVPPPGQVYNATQLIAALGTSTNTTIDIMSDIQMTSTQTSAAPLAPLVASFAGTLNGHGHTISNLQSPLIGTLATTGNINNLLINANLQVAPGGFAYGGTGAAAQINRGTIDSVNVTGVISAPGQVNVGSVAGYNYGTINNSSSSATVTAVSTAGGIVGLLDGGTVTGSTFTGNVSATNYMAGGIAGQMSSSATMVNVNASGGSVSSPSYAGGLVGYLLDGSVTDGISSATVSGTYLTGGLIGDMEANTKLTHSRASGPVSGATAVGGAVGQDMNGITSTTSSSGPVNGTSYVGGLIGYITGASPITQDSHTSSVVTALGNNIGGFAGASDGGTIAHSFAAGAVLPTGRDPASTQTGGFLGYTVGRIIVCVNALPQWPFHGIAINSPTLWGGNWGITQGINPTDPTAVSQAYNMDLLSSWNASIWNLTNTSAMPTLN